MSESKTISADEFELPCEACPFRLLREQNSEDCVNCNGVTNAGLARCRSQVQQELAEVDSVDERRIDEAISTLSLSLATTGLRRRFDCNRGSSEAAFVTGMLKKICTSKRRDGLPTTGLSEARGVASEQPGPESRTASWEIQRIVREAIAVLPPRYRQVICAVNGIDDPIDGQQRMPKELQSMTFFLLRRAERRLKHEILSRYPNIANVLNSHLKPDWRNRLDPVVPQIEEPVERHYAIDQFVSQVGRMIVGQFVTS